MMKSRLQIFIFVIAMGFALSLAALSPARAQQPQLGVEYTIANRLLDSQEYEQAYQRFLKLYRENPGTYLLVDRLTECLVNLQRYEEALRYTREYIDRDYNRLQGMVRLGEIHYIRGDTVRADSTWERVASDPSAGLQEMLTLARTMRDLRAFGRAVATYREAAGRYKQSSLVSSELASTHLMAGNYNEAMEAYLDLIAEQPDRIDELQSTLYRYSDDVLYDTAILELEETMPGLSTDHPAYQRLHQLHVWLLMERELYERALATSVEYEDRVSQVTYNLYVTGRRLASERQYELAVDAYRYYIDRDVTSVRQRSMQELAGVYIEWADYLDDYNLSHASRRDSLYRRAYGLLDELRTGGSYAAMGEVLVTQSELALSHLHRPGEARLYLQSLEEMRDSSLASRVDYLRGRILLHEGSYQRARVELTRSNRREGTGALAEKSRYYLALCDFYSGDYEFAKIQLNALERQNTSYFANDAVRLRVWIQDGLQADSTGGYLDRFSRAMRLAETGLSAESRRQLHAFADSTGGHPLRDDAWLQLANLVGPQSLEEIYPALDRYLENAGRGSPLAERLLWERVRMADQWLNGAGDTPPLSALAGGSGDPDASASPALPESNDALIALYEQILLRFPEGFYASFARDRIQELQSPNQT